MTLRNRILDMLPALIVFALVAIFASYVVVAYIVRDALWIATLAMHANDASTAPAPRTTAPPPR